MPASRRNPQRWPARLAVFASGRGSNLGALLDAFPSGGATAEVVLVVSNRTGSRALERARQRGVDSVFIDDASMPAFEAAAKDRLDRFKVDLICLAGFMRLLSADFVTEYEGKILNIHPSLLPAFRGLHAQRQALEAGVDESGCTVHFVDVGIDTGPTVLQWTVPIYPDDTERRLSARILAEEHRAYPEAIRRVVARVKGNGEAE